MRIVLKHNKCDIKGNTAELFVDTEDFKEMLNTVSAKILSDYLWTRMKPKVQAVNNLKTENDGRAQEKAN